MMRGHGASVSHAGGMKACSRWLSGVTPPDNRINMNCTPVGVPAIAVYGINPMARITNPSGLLISILPHHFPTQD